MRVEQSFGNCPNTSSDARRASNQPAPDEDVDIRVRAGLDPWSRPFDRSRGHALRGRAMWIPPHGGEKRTVDVAHRGGKPGFVRVGDDDTLTIPDFVGNFLFNTLGNLLLNPRAGGVLRISAPANAVSLRHHRDRVGTARRSRASPAPSACGAYGRWRLRLCAPRCPLRAELEEVSPNLAGTGDWNS
jgi:hypothetical protein